MSHKSDQHVNEFIGLLPAAGRGSRLGAIPCSKEIMPLGFRQQPAPHHTTWQPITAIEHHLRALELAGARRTAIVMSESKSDVVRYLGSGSRYGLSIVYLYQQHLRGMPFALNLATPWIGSATTLFAMPDTLITPIETMARLAHHHKQYPADLTLGLFYTTTPHKFGMVELDPAGQVVGFVDKPTHTDLNLMWGIAAWSPYFSRFLSTFLDRLPQKEAECVLSDVFFEALCGGLTVQAVILKDARYHDIGTPEDFQAVVFDLAAQQAIGSSHS